MAMPLEERQTHRLQYLRAVYDESEGVAGRFLQFHGVGEKLGFEKKHAEECADYLASEGLLEYAAMGIISLTHLGLKEVEESISAPERSTEHFPALVVAQNYMRVGSISQSQVQQGMKSSIQVNAPTADELRRLVADLQALLAEFNLTEDQHHEVEADLATIDVQLGSPNPKASLISECLSSVRSVLESALGGGLAVAAPHLPMLVERVTHALKLVS